MKTEEKKAQWTLGDQNGHGGISVMEGEDRIATVYLGTISSRWKWGEETFRRPENAEAMKRAHIISASQDMLKALTALKKIIDREGIGSNAAESERACMLMESAIAKAEGGKN